jgi:hypothetical protein
MRAHNFQDEADCWGNGLGYSAVGSIRSIADRHTDCAASVESLKLWRICLEIARGRSLAKRLKSPARSLKNR